MAWPAVIAARPRPWWTLTLKYVVLGDGRHPGVSGERVAQGGEDVDAVLGGGGNVASDGVAVPGCLLRARAGRESSAESWPVARPVRPYADIDIRPEASGGSQSGVMCRS